MDKIKFEKREKRAKKMVSILKKLFSENKNKTALKYKNPWELLVSVILSAQCTDERVNMVTKKLFKKYKKLDDYTDVKLSEFEKDIKPTGFYKNKAKNIIKSANIIRDDYGGKIPKKMDELIKLSGVGRKTANVVLSNAFGIVNGIAVDTHVRRFSYRFDLSDSLDPVKIEEDLMELLPKKDWTLFSNYLIRYGREYCPARKHDCSSHPLTKIYLKANNRWLSDIKNQK